MRKHANPYILCAVALAVTLVFSCAAQAGAGGRKMVVIVADHVSFDDWQHESLTNIRELEKQGALGLMITRNESIFPYADEKELELDRGQ